MALFAFIAEQTSSNVLSTGKLSTKNPRERLGKWSSQLCDHITLHFANTPSWLLIALKAHGFDACKMAVIALCLLPLGSRFDLGSLFLFFSVHYHALAPELSVHLTEVPFNAVITWRAESCSWEILVHCLGLKPLPWNRLDYFNIPDLFVCLKQKMRYWIVSSFIPRNCLYGRDVGPDEVCLGGFCRAWIDSIEWTCSWNESRWRK